MTEVQALSSIAVYLNSQFSSIARLVTNRLRISAILGEKGSKVKLKPSLQDGVSTQFYDENFKVRELETQSLMDSGSHHCNSSGK